jgi:hypothetical protein
MLIQGGRCAHVVVWWVSFGVVLCAFCNLGLGAVRLDSVGASYAELSWDAVAGVTRYAVSVSMTDEDFEGDAEVLPSGWGGDRDAFAVLHAITVPGGVAESDGCYLASLNDAGDSALVVPSAEVHAWSFSLASPDFQPSDLNYIGVVLMSDRSLFGDIATNVFRGYYLRIGSNGSDDPLRLYRSTGVGKVQVGHFSGGPVFGEAGVCAGATFCVTRTDDGVWEAAWREGFDDSAMPLVSCGELVDNAYDVSGYFGVFSHTSGPQSGCRVYLDNVQMGPVTYVEGYRELEVVGDAVRIEGLESAQSHVCRVVPLDVAEGIADSSAIGFSTRWPVVTALHVSEVDAASCRVEWDATSSATGYVCDVLTVLEDFPAPSVLREPQWDGDHTAFEICSDGVLPGGRGEAAGSYLVSRPSVGNAILMRPSEEVHQWQFTVGSPDFNPSDANFLGAILMSSESVSGDIAAADFEGYYLKVGDNGSDDRIELWCKRGVAQSCVGAFAMGPLLGDGCLRDGSQVRVTRSDTGCFRLWSAIGFLPDGGPPAYGGELFDSTYSTTRFFGVFTHFSSPSSTRRIYVDHIAFGQGLQVRPIGVSDCEVLVPGLKPGQGYLFRVRPLYVGGVGMDVGSFYYQVPGGEVAHAGSLFMFK